MSALFSKKGKASHTPTELSMMAMNTEPRIEREDKEGGDDDTGLAVDEATCQGFKGVSKGDYGRGANNKREGGTMRWGK